MRGLLGRWHILDMAGRTVSHSVPRRFLTKWKNGMAGGNTGRVPFRTGRSMERHEN